MLCIVIFIQYQSVTDMQTHRRIDTRRWHIPCKIASRDKMPSFLYWSSFLISGSWKKYFYVYLITYKKDLFSCCNWLCDLRRFCCDQKIVVVWLNVKFGMWRMTQLQLLSTCIHVALSTVILSQRILLCSMIRMARYMYCTSTEPVEHR